MGYKRKQAVGTEVQVIRVTVTYPSGFMLSGLYQRMPTQIIHQYDQEEEEEEQGKYTVKKEGPLKAIIDAKLTNGYRYTLVEEQGEVAHV